MSKLCPNCGQIVEDDVIKCNNCNTDIPLENNQVESIENVDTGTINDIPEVNTTIQDFSVEDQSEQNLENPSPLQLQEVEVVVNNLDDVMLDESIEAKKQAENQAEQLENFVIPEMPQPEIGEINPQLLGSIYKQEAVNNEKKETKRKMEEAEFERKRQEEEAKRQMPMKKPDLLAGINTATEDLEPENIEKGKKDKKKMRKVMNIIIIILAIALIGVGVYYLTNHMKETSASTYMDPISTYFEGYSNSNVELMLSSFVPCLSKTEEIATEINNLINARNQYGAIEVDFKEKNVEVVNGDDQSHLDDYLSETCSTDSNEITDYKHVFVEQTITVTDTKEVTTNEPEFWVVQINEQWYILSIQ